MADTETEYYLQNGDYTIKWGTDFIKFYLRTLGAPVIHFIKNKVFKEDFEQGKKDGEWEILVCDDELFTTQYHTDARVKKIINDALDKEDEDFHDRKVKEEEKDVLPNGKLTSYQIQRRISTFEIAKAVKNNEEKLKILHMTPSMYENQVRSHNEEALGIRISQKYFSMVFEKYKGKEKKEEVIYTKKEVDDMQPKEIMCREDEEIVKFYLCVEQSKGLLVFKMNKDCDFELVNDTSLDPIFIFKYKKDKVFRDNILRDVMRIVTAPDMVEKGIFALKRNEQVFFVATSIFLISGKYKTEDGTYYEVSMKMMDDEPFACIAMGREEEYEKHKEAIQEQIYVKVENEYCKNTKKVTEAKIKIDELNETSFKKDKYGYRWLSFDERKYALLHKYYKDFAGKELKVKNPVTRNLCYRTTIKPVD